jgi:hypothetical protein
MAPEESREQRIAAIKQQLMELAAELEKLEQETDGNGDEPPRRKFTLLPGGLAAMVLPAFRFVRRAPRTAAAAASLATVGAVAAAVVLGAPHRRAPAAIQSGPMMPMGSVTSPLAIPSSTGATTRGAAPSSTATAPGYQTPIIIPVTTAAAPGASSSGASSPPGTTGSASASPTSSSAGAAPSPSCLIEATVTGVLDVCIL